MSTTRHRGHALERGAPAPAARAGGEGRRAAAEEARVAGERAVRARAPGGRQPPRDRAAGAGRRTARCSSALAASGAATRSPLGWPTREVRVRARADARCGACARWSWSARPSLVRSLAARGAAPGPGDAAAARRGRREFERLVEQLLDAAPEELFMRRLGPGARARDAAGEHARAAGRHLARTTTCRRCGARSTSASARSTCGWPASSRGEGPAELEGADAQRLSLASFFALPFASSGTSVE